MTQPDDAPVPAITRQTAKEILDELWAGIGAGLHDSALYDELIRNGWPKHPEPVAAEPETDELAPPCANCGSRIRYACMPDCPGRAEPEPDLGPGIRCPGCGALPDEQHGERCPDRDPGPIAPWDS